MLVNCAAAMGRMVSRGGNVEDRDQCGLTLASDQKNTNPLLGPLQDNGGPIDTRAIPLTEALFAEGIELARQALGEGAFATAWAAGRAGRAAVRRSPPDVGPGPHNAVASAWRAAGGVRDRRERAVD